MMDKEIKMKLLKQLMEEMDDSTMSKLDKKDEIMPEDPMVKVKEVKVDEVPASEAKDLVADKIEDAMEKDSMDDDSEVVDMEEDEDYGDKMESSDMEDEEDDEYAGSRLMQRLKKLKKG